MAEAFLAAFHIVFATFVFVCTVLWKLKSSSSPLTFFREGLQLQVTNVITIN